MVSLRSGRLNDSDDRFPYGRDGLRVETGCAHADHSDQLKKRVVLRDLAFLRADDAGSHLDPLGPSASFHFRCVSPHIIGWAMLFYASGNVVLPASYRWHATWWLGDTSRKGGSTSAQRGIAKG